MTEFRVMEKVGKGLYTVVRLDGADDVVQVSEWMTSETLADWRARVMEFREKNPARRYIADRLGRAVWMGTLEERKAKFVAKAVNAIFTCVGAILQVAALAALCALGYATLVLICVL